MSRSDQNRAVFHAQMWLLKTQPLALYFGVTYDVYEIYKKNDDGKWVNIDTGGVKNAEMGRNRARETRTSQESSESTKKTARAKTTKASQSTRGKAQADRGERTFPWPTPRHNRKKTLTPLQQRIADVKERARQILAEKKARGDK